MATAAPGPTSPGSSNGDSQLQNRQFSPDALARGSNGNVARVAHTLTACSRCRKRKSRCDPGLPSCHPCARTNAVCEYYDTAKGRLMPRTYIVGLQDQVKALEKELAELEIEAKEEPDPEAMVREAAVVRLASTDERKYLGASSGTSLTRIIMQLAKKVVGVDSIADIISSDKARQVREKREQEETKATSKDVDYQYPLTSLSPNPDLPSQDLALTLLRLYNIKVQTMYPLFHEPTLQQHFHSVYTGSQDPYENFIMRMVLAIALQRGETRLAGLGDSYYLAAMTFFEAVVAPMDIHTLHCFVLVAQYSLLTPTRTAVYYVVGLAVRLAQALGITEERTLTLNQDGSPASPFDMDMRRRVFWAVITMDYGLAHSLGRPAMMATAQAHIDVRFFEPIDDSCITREGFIPGAFSTRKWIAIHFYKMRMLQLEIRRTLYLKKRPRPTHEDDPWFIQMKAKMDNWRDASPNNDESSGFSKEWFQGRYNTLIIMLYRPSPQIPRPSHRAAIECYQAAEFNINMQRQQIATKSVELTWIFTQTIFSCINIILWSLSYAEVRRLRSKEEVERHLQVALNAIYLASERWPGVYAALELYQILIRAILIIYDKEGDVPVSALSPFESDWSSSPNADGDSISRSQNTSPLQFSASLESVDPPLFPSDILRSSSKGQSMRKRTLSSPQGHVSVPSVGSSRGHLSPEYRPQAQFDTSPASSYRSDRPLMDRKFAVMPSTFAEMQSWNFTVGAGPQHQINEQDIFGIGPLLQAGAAHMGNMGIGQPNALGFHAAGFADGGSDSRGQNWLAQMSRNEGMSRAQQQELLQGLESRDGLDKLETQIAATNAHFDRLRGTSNNTENRPSS